MNRTATVFGLLGATVVVAGLGCKRHGDAAVATADDPSKPIPAAAPRPPEDLATARAGFTTRLRPPASPEEKEGPAETAPAGTYTLVHFPAPPGPLAAYLSIAPTEPTDAAATTETATVPTTAPAPTGPVVKRPAVVWCHGGFGGIGPFFAMRQPSSNDQTPRPFVDAGFVVMIPSTRGTNDNPGRPELFYGEVDDALAAVDYVSKLPEVDPARVYVVGHSTGGTLALLVAEAAPPGKVRAVASFGGAPDMRRFLTGENAALAPFDRSDPREMRLRSATNFVEALKTPTWYFEGSTSGHVQPALAMGETAAEDRAPLHVTIVDGGTHFNILRPVVRLVAERFAADVGPTCDVAIDPAAVRAAYAAEESKRQQTPAAVVRLTPAAKAELAAALRRRAAGTATPVVAMQIDTAGRPHLTLMRAAERADALVRDGDARVAINREVAAEFGPMELDYDRTATPPFTLRHVPQP